MNVISFSVELLKLCLKVSAYISEDSFHEIKHLFGEEFFAVFGYKNQMNVHEKNAMSSMPNSWGFALFYSFRAISWAF
jgi:hypothetical protein